MIAKLEQLLNRSPQTCVAERQTGQRISFKCIGSTGNHQRLWIKLPPEMKHRVIHQVR